MCYAAHNSGRKASQQSGSQPFWRPGLTLLCAWILSTTSSSSYNPVIPSLFLPVWVWNLDWSLSSLSCCMAAWTFLAHSHGYYSTLCVCSLHFPTAVPFKWLCAKLKISVTLCCSLHSLASPRLFPNFSFLWSAPSFTPSHTVGYTHTHSGSHPHTSIQTRPCLLCTDKSPLFVRTHSLDYYCTNFSPRPV